MKSVSLKNFECFADSHEIPFHKITVFVGENDSGKSAILKALDIFFNSKPMTPDLFHKINKDVQNECEIQIKFNSLHKNDINFPKQYIVNDEVTVKKVFSLDDNNLIKSELLINAIVFSQLELNNILSLKSPELKKLCLQYDLQYTNVDDSQKILHQYTQDHFDSLPKNEELTKIKWADIIGFLPVYEYYDSSSYGNPVQLVTNTLKTVYRSYFYDLNEQGQETLKTDLIEKKKTIEKELDNRIQTELKGKIQEKNSKIVNIFGNYLIDFGSGFQLHSLQADFGQGLRDINNIGEGSKKRLFLAITEWDKEVRSKKAYKKVIRGYDEPDTSLHYKAQKEIFYTLKNLSEQAGINVQPILCTHSLSMIDRAPARIINHVINNEGKSHVEFLKGEEEKDIKDFLDDVSTISGISNSSLFFERCFLIVEGETEYNALPGFFKKITGKNLREDGIVIVNLEGNGSWKTFLKLLNKNKQNATVLFLDSDIQEDGRRSVTPQSMREVGFNDSFIETNVVFVGTKEFEDIFSNECLTRYLNTYHSKEDGEEWCCADIENLRNDGKFSDKIQKMVGKYQNEKVIKNRDFKKPEFGIKIAELITRAELQDIEALRSLVVKISSASCHLKFLKS